MLGQDNGGPDVGLFKMVLTACFAAIGSLAAGFAAVMKKLSGRNDELEHSNENKDETIKELSIEKARLSAEKAGLENEIASLRKKLSEDSET